MNGAFDICIIGSGAGAGPVALQLARAGHRVLVLEKGPWFTEQDFYKDELACCRRSVYTPPLEEEQHVLEEADGDGGWQAMPTAESGWDFWNGNCVGGSSNFMSGFFYRLKPIDFRLRSEFGPIEGANLADWPIDYEDLEPYYTRVETEVGISGRVVPHPFAEPRSTPDFPFPPTAEHPIAARIDAACRDLGLHPLPTPRAILSRPVEGRRSCEYSGYCGSYGCSSGAKGSARAALLNRALLTGRCEVRPRAKVHRLRSDGRGRVVAAEYFDAEGNRRQARARLFVVACQAIETARLLLGSPGPRHPHGLGNNQGQVGRNLLFSAGGVGTAEFRYDRLDPEQAAALKRRGPFVNRGLQDWYVVEDSALGSRLKGGTIDFLLRHPNPIARAMRAKWGDDDRLQWGRPLQRQLQTLFTEAQQLRFEVFCDWLPTDDCFVSLDPQVKDRWGTPVARVRLGYHPHDLKIGAYLTERAEEVLRAMGADAVRSSVSGSPPQNLVAGGCRFGNDPRHSVLDADCRVHDVDNLYVTDGSFMPTGGSVPYTWTIYANAFRVADRLLERL
ncbi:GMC family oxidoreductase [Thiohalobacter sp. IOR34]|uniref:GMC family oxidoreductase n=1 Tax=Thiohalobacter sp. IOR34 TaxID=3057176 RepID=UPI0025B0208E|nr:GMC family oxidoreductase [Thiohalobacter sp. IOR34]WJW75979.1 GMC family oxidoreductase [Thiohalobacter sp. IOR34]